MRTSIFLAQLLGPVFFILGTAALVGRQKLRDILSEFIDSPALTYFAGFLGLLAGAALVLSHNIWTRDWRVLITLIGWITITRAFVTLFLPERVGGMGRWLLRHRSAFPLTAFVPILVGAVLSFFGYWS